MEERIKPMVLIVDDVVTNIQILAESLKNEYRIRVASKGVDALRLAALQPQPDLILLDVMMPEMDGYEVCRQLKSNPATQSIPVIFVTARDDASDEETGLMMGAVDYIVKPYRLPIVKARVRTHIWLKQKNDLLEKLALIDGLTNIPNRRHFDQSLEHELRRAAREKESMAVMMIDVDLFKRYNDGYGHGAGDMCLRAVAHAMQNVLNRAGDFLGRYGGEEFAVVLPNTDAEGARQIAERLRESIEAMGLPHEHAPCGVVTVSVGYAVYQTDNNDPPSPEQILQQADAGLYLAKSTGRNKVCCIS